MESIKKILVVQKNEMESFKDRKNKNQVVQKNIKTKNKRRQYQKEVIIGYTLGESVGRPPWLQLTRPKMCLNFGETD